eukprot:6061366-Pyramimonas_sp.AAC.1
MRPPHPAQRFVAKCFTEGSRGDLRMRPPPHPVRRFVAPYETQPKVTLATFACVRPTQYSAGPSGDGRM